MRDVIQSELSEGNMGCYGSIPLTQAGLEFCAGLLGVDKVQATRPFFR
jgi:hypothetical protein